MDKYKKYPAYKDSGVEWLGDIPEGWGKGKVGQYFDIQLGKMLQNTPATGEDQKLSYLKALNVQWENVESNPEFFEVYDSKGKLIRKMDLNKNELESALLQIDTQDLPSGLFFIRLHGEKLDIKKQFIIILFQATYNYNLQK